MRRSIPGGSMMQRLAAGLLLITIAIAACDGSLPTTTDGVDGSTTSTEAPETTEAPDTTVAEDDAKETPWWILVVVGFGLVVVIGALVARGSRSATAVPPPVTWKSQARAGYAEARWLYDAMSEDVAVWRGNATFEGTTSVDATAGTSKAETWAELQLRLGKASDALYALEANAPDQRSRGAAQQTLVAMRANRDALDARAEARLAYRKAESEGSDPDALVEARNREVRASRNLAEARNSFARALTDLSTVV